MFIYIIIIYIIFFIIKDNTDLAFGEANLEKKFPFEKNDCAQLLLLLQNFENVIDKIDYSVSKTVQDIDGYLFEGSFMIDLLQKAGIEKAAASSISSLVDKMGQFIVKNQFLAREFGLSSSEKLLEFANLVSTIYADSYEKDEATSSMRTCQKVASSLFKLYITKSNKCVEFHYWCFSAGHAMRYIQSRGVHSIIVASGTLSPLHQYINSIGM